MKKAHESQKGSSKNQAGSQVRTQAGLAAREAQVITIDRDLLFDRMDEMDSAIVRANGLLYMLGQMYADAVYEKYEGKLPEITEAETGALHFCACDAAEFLKKAQAAAWEAFLPERKSVADKAHEAIDALDASVKAHRESVAATQ